MGKKKTQRRKSLELSTLFFWRGREMRENVASMGPPHDCTGCGLHKWGEHHICKHSRCELCSCATVRGQTDPSPRECEKHGQACYITKGWIQRSIRIDHFQPWGQDSASWSSLSPLFREDCSSSPDILNAHNLTMPPGFPPSVVLPLDILQDPNSIQASSLPLRKTPSVQILAPSLPSCETLVPGILEYPLLHPDVSDAPNYSRQVLISPVLNDETCRAGRILDV